MTTPVIENLYAQTINGNFGIQPGYVKNTSVSSSLAKDENNNSIMSHEKVDFEEEIQRSFVRKPYGDTSGVSITDDLTSTISANQNKNWRTDW